MPECGNYGMEVIGRPVPWCRRCCLTFHNLLTYTWPVAGSRKVLEGHEGIACPDRAERELPGVKPTETGQRHDSEWRERLSKRTLSLAAAWLIFPLAFVLGQPTPPASGIPAATPSQADCTGFIAASKVPANIVVRDGPDNDLESSIRQFALGESLYLYGRGNPRFSVGEQFSLIRPGKELFRSTRYSGEHWTIRGLGEPYEDAGRAQVT